MQRFAKPCTSVQFRSGPPLSSIVLVDPDGVRLTPGNGDVVSRFSANILMCCAALVWGLTFIAQKTGMDTIGPMSFTFARYVMGALALLPLAWFESRRRPLAIACMENRTISLGALGLGGMMFGGMALQQTALQYTSIANAAFLTAFYVPLVPLTAYLLLRRHVNFTVWPAVALSIFGSFLLSGTSTVLAQLGDILTLCGAFFWAGHILLAQWLMKRVKTPFQLSFLQATVTAVCAGLFMVAFEQPDIADFTPVLPQIAFAGVVSVGIGFTLQLVAQRYTNAPAAALILSLESVFAAGFGWGLLGETLALTGILGCALIFLAIIIAEVVPENFLTKMMPRQFFGFWHKD